MQEFCFLAATAAEKRRGEGFFPCFLYARKKSPFCGPITLRCMRTDAVRTGFRVRLSAAVGPGLGRRMHSADRALEARFSGNICFSERGLAGLMPDVSRRAGGQNRMSVFFIIEKSVVCVKAFWKINTRSACGQMRCAAFRSARIRRSLRRSGFRVRGGESPVTPEASAIAPNGRRQSTYGSARRCSFPPQAPAAHFPGNSGLPLFHCFFRIFRP